MYLYFHLYPGQSLAKVSLLYFLKDQVLGFQFLIIYLFNNFFKVY